MEIIEIKEGQTTDWTCPNCETRLRFSKKDVNYQWTYFCVRMEPSITCPKCGRLSVVPDVKLSEIGFKKWF